MMEAARCNHCLGMDGVRFQLCDDKISWRLSKNAMEPFLGGLDKLRHMQPLGAWLGVMLALQCVKMWEFFEIEKLVSHSNKTTTAGGVEVGMFFVKGQT